MEIWKEIDNFEGYWISTYGRVKSVKPSGDLILKLKIKHSRKKNRLTKRENTGRENTGYVVIELRKDGVKKSLKVHRLVAIAFIPNPDNKPEVNHVDGIKTNCHVSNLEWSTRIENVDHSIENGLKQTKLKPYQVLEIKRLLAEGKPLSEIALIYNMSISAISAIKRKRSWAKLVAEYTV